MIERHFDIPFVSQLALREKQIQQNYRPVIAVHKWFARRPGTLFRALLLSEFAEPPLADSFYRSHQLKGIRIADPFMGGGTPLLEANRLGCEIIGFDINPMSYWIVRQEIEYLDLKVYCAAAHQLRDELETHIGHLYQTVCQYCASSKAQVKYFLWVKIQSCHHCGKDMDLFPGYLLAEDRRHPQNVFVCPQCGELSETPDRKQPGSCQICSQPLSVKGPARRNRCLCPHCRKENRYPDATLGPPRHRLFAMEYYCPACKKTHAGRFFKKPDVHDLAKIIEVENLFQNLEAKFIPDDDILPGVETDRLHRWGYRQYRQMFNHRQLLSLEISCRLINRQPDQKIKNALATNLSDLLRYQNMLCRYDTMALKSLDIFSVHGFPVGLVQCESNFLGIINSQKGMNVGSGGWSNIIDKFSKGKAYCDAPFEIAHQGERKVLIKVPGEWIGDHRNNGVPSERRKVDLSCQDASVAKLPHASLDAVFTDPPYFGNVQYAELMDFCYVWLRRLVGAQTSAFDNSTTRNANELTGNVNMGRDLEHFTQGLSTVFKRMSQALKPGAPLAFTYHHNTLEAYFPLAVAMLDAGLTCSATLPCPAEMGASIHISGTGSSIIDTIFVCRSTGRVPRRWIVSSSGEIAYLVAEDLEKLQAGKVNPTPGDIRCIIFGQIIRLAVWHLRADWQKEASFSKKLQTVSEIAITFGVLAEIENHLNGVWPSPPQQKYHLVRESEPAIGEILSELPF